MTKNKLSHITAYPATRQVYFSRRHKSHAYNKVSRSSWWRVTQACNWATNTGGYFLVHTEGWALFTKASPINRPRSTWTGGRSEERKDVTST